MKMFKKFLICFLVVAFVLCLVACPTGGNSTKLFPGGPIEETPPTENLVATWGNNETGEFFYFYNNNVFIGFGNGVAMLKGSYSGNPKSNGNVILTVELMNFLGDRWMTFEQFWDYRLELYLEELRNTYDLSEAQLNDFLETILPELEAEHYIDYIFTFKVVGKKSLESINVLTYKNGDSKKIEYYDNGTAKVTLTIDGQEDYIDSTIVSYDEINDFFDEYPYQYVTRTELSIN